MANAKLLLEERKRRNLTRLQAAVAIGISPQTLARAENGLGIQPKTLGEIARYYGLDATEAAAA